jgi:hypothetical protein
MAIRLLVEGQPVAPTSAWAVRWVDREDGPADAVLYRDGRRVTRAWSLELRIDQPADRDGGNANTD